MKKHTTPKRVRHDFRGFTLVLALMVMFLLLSLVTTLALFLSLELRISANSAEIRIARLNALTGARIAWAHIQQEAGPDQRVSAQASVTLPDPSKKPTNDSTRKLWAGKNPYWTGIWDTREKAQRRPPSWLVSGPKQLLSLAQQNTYRALGPDYQHPWDDQKLNDLEDPDTLVMVKEVPQNLADRPAPFPTRVTVRRVEIENSGVGENTSSFSPKGHFAYWVADEGVKARANTADRYADKAANTHQGFARLVAPGRTAIELLPRFQAITTNDDRRKTERVLDTPSFENIAGAHSANEGTITPSNIYLHALTPWSNGLFTSTTIGGLKSDLSLAFEQSDDDFKNSPFSIGAEGTTNERVTVTFDPDKNNIKNPRWETKKLNVLENSANNPDYRPVFNVKGVNSGNLFGPTWAIMRDYYRLYKPHNYVGGAFLGRTFGPDAWSNRNLIISRGESETYVFSHIMRIQRCDINTRDIATDGRAVMRPTSVMATYHTVRYMLNFGIQIKNGEGQGKKVLRLILNPIVVVHNPFNVPIKLRSDVIETYSGQKEPSGLRLSLRYNAAKIEIKKNGMTVISSTVQQICEKQPSFGSYGIGGKDNISLFIPDMVINPGEYRIFSTSNSEPVSWDRYIVLANRLDYFGGYYMNLYGGNDPNKGEIEVSDDDSIHVELSNSGDYYVRELIKNPTDEGNFGAQLVNDAAYHIAAEHQEFFLRRFSQHRNGNGASLELPPVSQLPVPGEPAFYFGVLEWTEKMTEYAGVGDEAITPIDDNIPTYAMTNPLGAVRYRDAYGTIGFHSSGWSWKYSQRGIPGGSLENVIEMKDALAFGGNSTTGRGRNRVIRAYIPRIPMSSIGEFQTAAINILDCIPLYSVGHSLPSLNVAANEVFHVAQGSAPTGKTLLETGTYTYYDHAYLLNATLWDNFFFSTIAPEVDARNLELAPIEKRDMEQVWKDFLDSPQTQTLQNQSVKLIADPKTKKAAKQFQLKDPDAYRKSAALLVQEGVFNINSVDERAWRAILASTRNVPVASGRNGATPLGESSGKTPFPRSLPTANIPNQSPAFASNDLTDDATWTSAKALTNDQIEKLAAALVEKIRFRLASEVHTVLYTAPDGSELRRPFFSLGEFINRAIYKASGARGDIGKVGVIQAALLSADKKDAKINTGLDARKLASGMISDEEATGAFPAPEVVELADGAIPIATGATGLLLQGDILQAIGSKLSARSDTFIIRSYGDVVSRTAPDKPASRAWLEMVVQRFPEYVSPDRDEADVLPDRLKAPANKYFGRRFRVISMRWLTSSEL